IYPANYDMLGQWQGESDPEDSVVDLAWGQIQDWDHTWDTTGEMDWWQSAFLWPSTNIQSPSAPTPSLAIVIGEGATPRGRARGLETHYPSLRTTDVEKLRVTKRVTRQHTQLHSPTNTMDCSLPSASSPEAVAVDDPNSEDGQHATPESLDARLPFHLRRASQASKRYTNTTLHKHANSKTAPLARKAHNHVEKRYRGRLNVQFESLLSILSDSGAEWEGRGGAIDLCSSKNVSKAETLSWAVRRINRLEEQLRKVEK
ncbi:hypothetical protein EV126DRAFT_409388, partial [Verticillium dahliae]